MRNSKPHRLFRVLVGALLLAGLARAAEPDFQWVVRAGGPMHDKTRGLAADAKGHVWATGEFTGTAQFGEHTVTARGGMDFFIAKYGAGGKCLWFRQGGGAKTDRGYDVEVDRQGNAYVTGHYESEDADFGDGKTLPQRGGYDVFVAKYDPEGKLLWLHTFGGAAYDYGHGIGVDGRGRCVATGAVAGPADLGRGLVDLGPGSHIFLVRYDASGRQELAQASHGGSGSGQALAVDGDGSIWISGNASGEVDFGGAVRSVPGKDILLVRFDPNGRALWAAGAGGNADGVSTGVVVDRAGNAYIGGMFKKVAVFGSDTFTSAGEYDVFTAKFDPHGKLLWGRHGGSPEIDYCLGMAAEPGGGCIAVGEYGDGATFGDRTLRSRGGRDLYVARYDAEGRMAQLLDAGGPGEDQTYCIARDGKGHVFLSGAFSGSTTLGKNSFTTLGSNDVFLAKVKL